MAVVGPVFFDTTILLGGLIEIGAGDAAQRGMDALVAGRIPNPQTAWHCCLEFFSVSTRLPEEYRLDLEDARRLVEEEILPRFTVLELPADHRIPMLREVAGGGGGGGRIYDRHIGAVALAAGTRTLVTENLKHFEFLRIRGVRVVSAGELLADLA